MPPKRKINAANNGQPRAKRDKPSDVPLTLVQRSRGRLAMLPDDVLQMIADRVAGPVSARKLEQHYYSGRNLRTPSENLQRLKEATSVGKRERAEGEFVRTNANTRRDMRLVQTSSLRELVKLHNNAFATEMKLSRSNGRVLRALFERLIASKVRRDVLFPWLDNNIGGLNSNMRPRSIAERLGWMLPCLLRVLKASTPPPPGVGYYAGTVISIVQFVMVVWYYQASNAAKKWAALEVVAEISYLTGYSRSTWIGAAKTAILFHGVRDVDAYGVHWFYDFPPRSVNHAMKKRAFDDAHRQYLKIDIVAFARLYARQMAGRGLPITAANKNTTLDLVDREMLHGKDAKQFFRTVLRYVVRTDDPELVSWFVRFASLTLAEEPRKWFKYATTRQKPGAALGFLRAGHALNVRNTENAPSNWNSGSHRNDPRSNVENDMYDNFATVMRMSHEGRNRRTILDEMQRLNPQATYRRLARRVVGGG